MSIFLSTSGSCDFVETSGDRLILASFYVAVFFCLCFPQLQCIELSRSQVIFTVYEECCELSCGLTISVPTLSGRDWTAWRSLSLRCRRQGRHCRCLSAWKFHYISPCQPPVPPSSPRARMNKRQIYVQWAGHRASLGTNAENIHYKHQKFQPNIFRKSSP